MQATQYAAAAAAVVILNELVVGTGCFVERPLVEALVEKAASVSEDLGLDNQDVGDGSRSDFHELSAMGRCAIESKVV